jgi:thiosulfate reductase cytochrome b subunit
VNIIGALVLGTLLTPEIAAQLGGLVAFVNSIYWLLLAYGLGFLGIPLIRYFWIQRRNPKVEARNQMRRDRAQSLHQATPTLRHKIAYARQFAEQKVLTDQDIIYTTETDVLDQDLNRTDRIDEEWRRRLDRGQ